MATNLCPICNDWTLETEHDLARGMCTPCSNRLGVVVMPPARRRAVPCRGCNGMKFVRAIPREISAWPAPYNADPLVSLMTVTYEDPERSGPLNARGGLGLLEVYVCKKCGLVEWYCGDVEQIPIGPRYMTEEIDYESETPYR